MGNLAAKPASPLPASPQNRLESVVVRVSSSQDGQPEPSTEPQAVKVDTKEDVRELLQSSKTGSDIVVMVSTQEAQQSLNRIKALVDMPGQVDKSCRDSFRQTFDSMRTRLRILERLNVLSIEEDREISGVLQGRALKLQLDGLKRQLVPLGGSGVLLSGIKLSLSDHKESADLQDRDQTIRILIATNAQLCIICMHRRTFSRRSPVEKEANSSCLSGKGSNDLHEYVISFMRAFVFRQYFDTDLVLNHLVGARMHMSSLVGTWDDPEANSDDKARALYKAYLDVANLVKPAAATLPQ